MLAMLKAKKKEIGAQWIVFDGIDVLLTLLQDPVAEMREIYRIRDWLADNELTRHHHGQDRAAQFRGRALRLPAVHGRLRGAVRAAPGGRRLAHRLQITKYRGSDFAAAEFPVSFGPSGMEVGAAEPAEIGHEASSERISAGFERLDTMLGGGVFRGSSTLITGVPGTSKTTLAGKFAEAACRRGERTLFVSFDEGAEQIVRNLSSVGIQLKPHVKSGLLRMYSARTESIGAEDHLVKLKSLIREHRPRCMVIDPLSAIAKAGGLGAARAVANRLIYMVKDEGITVLVTAISETDDPRAEATDLQVSTIADTWIHLSYLIRSGERNRALTIIKSRGTWHSNQVRELILSTSGPTLADVYTAGGEVLMGTLRWEKEDEESARKTRQRARVRPQAPRAAVRRSQHQRPDQGPAAGSGAAARRAGAVLRRRRSAHCFLERAGEGAAQEAQRGPGRPRREAERKRSRKMSRRRRKPRQAAPASRRSWSCACTSRAARPIRCRPSPTWRRSARNT